MKSDAVEPAAVETNGEVMAAIEENPVERLIIADVSTDDAYLTVPVGDAVSLSEWR
jgi:hypothetical protein